MENINNDGWGRKSSSLRPEKMDGNGTNGLSSSADDDDESCVMTLKIRHFWPNLAQNFQQALRKLLGKWKIQKFPGKFEQLKWPSSEDLACFLARLAKVAWNDRMSWNELIIPSAC